MRFWNGLKVGILLVLLSLVSMAHGQTLDQTYVAYHNALNNGSTCTGTTLAAAVTAIGAAEKTLVITRTTAAKVNCTWIISSDLTIPANIRLWIPFGTLLQVQPGATLTFSGDPLIDNPDSITGAGTVIFLAPRNQISQSYALTGCWSVQPASGVSLAAFPCTARIRHGNRSFDVKQDPLGIGPLNLGDGTYWVAMNYNSGAPAAGWTQQASSKYLWKLAATRPAGQPGVMVFMTVIVTGGNITGVGDLREDDENNQETDVGRALWDTVGNNSTDDTAALQRVVNSVLWKDNRVLVIPHARNGACYAITKLYFNYDPTNNPGAPKTSEQQGRMIVRGYGPSSERDILDDVHPGTCIRTTDTVGPAITVAQCPTCSGTVGNKRVDFVNIHFEGTTSGSIVFVNETSQLSWNNVSVEQGSNTGTGVLLQDVFQFSWRVGYILGPGSLTGTGIGVHMTNPDNNQAGNIEYNGVSVRNFGTCWQYGTDAVSDNVFTTIVYQQIQGKGCVYAMKHLGQTRATLVNASYFETFEHGPTFSGFSKALTFTSNNVGGGQVVAGGASLRIGDDRWAAQNTVGGVIVHGNNFNNVPTGTYGIHRLVTNDDDTGTSISYNSFIGAGTYIYLDGFTDMRGLTIAGNRFGASLTPIDGPASERADLQLQFGYMGIGRIMYTNMSDPLALTNASTAITIGQSGNNIRINVTGGAATVTSVALTDLGAIAIPAGTVIRFFLIPGSDGLTLVNGATLHLEGNANKVLTPGDSLQLMLFQSEWWQVSPLILTTP